MADAIVSAAVEVILETLTAFAMKEINLHRRLKDELKSLENTFTTLQLLLQDAEIKQRNNKPMQNWLRKLKDAVYDVENILDKMAIESHKREDAAERCKSCVCLRNPLALRCKMVHKVRNIREKLSDIAEERLQFNLEQGVPGTRRFGTTLESRETTSLVTESEVYGRRAEKEMITEKLLDNLWDQDDLSIYAICGMGGLGKTTLAQLVYNDQRIESHFELRIWVCVSDDFDIKRLVKDMIVAIHGDARKISGIDKLETLQGQIRERLRGRRLLLVLDDVWNENQSSWDQLKEIIRCDSKGSVLVITTRNEKIASMMATIGVHHIGSLKEGDSWSLFQQKASSTGKVDDNLVAIGKAIVEKCRGVPLAIKTLGSLMRFKCGEREWLEIQESKMWKLSSDENGILHVLRLSYDKLLPRMRQCFAYCCLFPKDYEMKEKELIQLWMANGFVHCNMGQQDLFLAGCLVFKELTWRSFFQDIKTNARGERTCKMHDLMHDLAMSVMGHETHISEYGELEKIPRTVRHLSLLEVDSNIVSELKLTTDGSLRSLYLIKCAKSHKKVFSSFLSKQQHIRALKMTQTCITEVLISVCKLDHLRYLCMSCDEIKKLPESLTHLCNLQTLKLMNSRNLVELPNDLRRMKNLWFLEMDSFGSLRCTPPGLGELTSLHELSVFIAGEGESQQLDQLKELNLGGELNIKGLNNVRNMEEAKSVNLRAKKNLTVLRLFWNIEEHTNKSPEYFEEVLQALEPPHQNLKRICMEWYQGSAFPNWMSTLSDFEKLEEITLKCCPKCEKLPTMGKLPHLRRLEILKMDSVTGLGVEWHGDAECSFPALTELKIEDIPNLQEWSTSDLKSFPRLNRLKITGCPKLDILPFLPSLKNLLIWNCNEALVSSATCLTTLENLCLKHVDIKTPPDTLDSLSSLKVLTFWECDDLTSFPASLLDGLHSLRFLHFKNCKKLKPLMGPLNSETSLQLLEIQRLPELEFFPQSLQQFNSLSTLRISVCEKLTSFPDWFASLKSLRKLDIFGCPQLEKRCRKKPDGEDWPKISHIPFIEINGTIIQILDKTAS